MVKSKLLLFFLLLSTLGTAMGQEKWGIIRVCCAHLRAKPAHSSEMVTEAIMGTPVKILDREGEWYKIQTPDDYESWVHPASVSVRNSDKMQEWRSARRYVYTGFQGFVYQRPDKSASPVSDVVSGCIVVANGDAKGMFLPVVLPDGRQGFVSSDEVRSLKEWANTSPDMKQMEAFAYKMMGSTYLWGGTSVKGVDCSGYTRIIYFTSGILLMRDASQQAKTGEKISPDDWKNCKTGDLLFFGNEAGRVNHVGFYLRDGKFIHSAGIVHISSLDKQSPVYHSQNLVGISRVASMLGTPGIMRLKDHSWYF